MAIYDKVDEVIKNIFQSLVNRYLIGKKHQLGVVILSWIILICCITNVIK